MKVKLLGMTPNPIDIIYTACRTCYSKDDPIDIWTDTQIGSSVPPKARVALIDQVYKSGHHSVLEHVSFNFAIAEVSRAFTHQLVRHRHAAFSQQSQRYVDMQQGFIPVMPESISTDVKAYESFINIITKTQQTYNELRDYDCEPEDARSVLPNATPTNIVVTVNLREMIHICGLRLCVHAQEEFYQVVDEMRRQIIKIVPEFKSYLQPQCIQLGYCPEQREPKGCLMPTKSKLLLIYKDHKNDPEYREMK